MTPNAAGSSLNTASCGRVTKRSSNACARCRRQKIKCTGAHPCTACSRRKLSCQFDDQDQKILVTRGYLNSLEERVATLEQNDDGRGDGGFDSSANHDDGEVCDRLPPRLSAGDGVSPEIQHAAVGNRSQPHSQGPRDVTLTNPFLTEPSSFMASDSGRTCTSSNWSFTRRVLNVTHEHIHNLPIPSATLLFDSEAYNLAWQSDRAATSAAALPTIDYATHLVNVVTFHCGQVFHLYDEEDFMGHLRDHYDESVPVSPAQELWLVHFQLVLAFGKAFSAKTRPSSRPPGAGFFVNALHALPNTTVLWRDPVQATEILCCIALYLHCIDYRGSAYNYIGQAVRMAMSQGMHTDVPAQQLGEAVVQRYRKAWWTVYVLDQEMTSLMGLPQSIRREDVHTQLPTFAGDPFRTEAFIMRTRLSHFIAGIDRAVYGPDGRLDDKFLLRTKDALAGLAELTDELHERYPLLLDNDESGISRLSAHLHLLYHQCIVLATRPLLFCFFKFRLESLGSVVELQGASQTVRSLLQMCLDSSQHVILILERLQHQGLLETFLSFDLEALFISATNILVAPVIYPETRTSWLQWRQRSYAVFDELARIGNLIADFERSELDQLGRMLDSINLEPMDNDSNTEMPAFGSSIIAPRAAEASRATASASAPHGVSPFAVLGGGVLDENYFATEFSAVQIMDMVNSINSDQTEWMSQAITQYGV